MVEDRSETYIGPLFESDTEGKRRSVVFAMAIMSAFISVVAAASVGVTTGVISLVLVFALAGFLLSALAVLVFVGRAQSLFVDEELLWTLSERGR
jgi:hypothetical protein